VHCVCLRRPYLSLQLNTRALPSDGNVAPRPAATWWYRSISKGDTALHRAGWPLSITRRPFPAATALNKELGKSRAMTNILAAQSAEMRAKAETLERTDVV
jgi:hypothetical protein